MPAQLLTPLLDRDLAGISIFVQLTEAPVLKGTDPHGDTFLCGKCRATLAQDLEPGAVWDLGFRCQQCNTVSASPQLPPGRPLPQKTKVVEPGEYFIRTVDLPSDAVFAGRSAADRRRRETGEPSSHAPNQLGASFLYGLANRAQALLGDDFDKLDAAYRRGLQRTATPPKNSHRLVELIATAREDGATLSGPQPGYHALETVELALAVDLLERWKRDPSLPDLLNSMIGTQDFSHTLVTLAAASLLTDLGNAVELVPTAPDKRLRTPDLRVHIGARSRVNTEVKVPTALVRPQEPLDADKATEVVRHAVSKAGTGASGQLSPEHAGFLVIGALHARVVDIDRLEEAARLVASERPKDRVHIAGISIVAAGALLTGVTADRAGLRIGGNVSAHAVLTTRMTLNPSYSGETIISPERGPNSVARSVGPEIADLTFDTLNTSERGGKIGRNAPCWCGSAKKFKKCHGA